MLRADSRSAAASFAARSGDMRVWAAPAGSCTWIYLQVGALQETATRRVSVLTVDPD